MLGFLRALNTHAVAVSGLVVGGGTLIITAVYGWFHLVEDPHYLESLYFAFVHLKHQVPLSDADIFAVMQLLGVSITVAGAIVLSLLAAFFGRSPNIPKNPPGSGGAPTETP